MRKKRESQKEGPRKKKSIIKKTSKNEAISKRTAKAVVVVKERSRKVNKIQYSLDSLETAISAVKKGLSIRKAAKAYSIPVSTLAYKIKDPLVEKKKTGPSTVLQSEEEYKIVEWIICRARVGYPVTKTELLDSVQKYVEESRKETPFIDNRPGRHWYEGFKKRHPNLSLRTPQQLSHSRAAVTQEDLKAWFKEQRDYLDKKKLVNIAPNRVFNCDETSLMLCPASEKVITEKGSTSVYKIDDGGKECLTVLFMYNADGMRGPPLIMYPYKDSIPKKIIGNSPKGWGIGHSENGWMTGEAFFEYIANVFHPWVKNQGIEFPIIIYMDNHSSHISIPLSAFCRENKIELIGLYPNSTHLTQPLDTSYFRPFKDMWKKCVPTWKNENKVAKLKKEDFPQVLQYTLDNFKNDKDVIKNGFKSCGLMPFDENALNYDLLQKKKTKQIEKKDLQPTETMNKEPINQLELFEKIIPTDLLQNFKACFDSKEWTGKIEDTSLFRCWLQLKDNSSGRQDYVEKSRIKSTQIVNLPTNKSCNLSISKNSYYNLDDKNRLEAQPESVVDPIILELPSDISAEELNSSNLVVDYALSISGESISQGEDSGFMEETVFAKKNINTSTNPEISSQNLIATDISLSKQNECLHTSHAQTIAPVCNPAVACDISTTAMKVAGSVNHPGSLSTDVIRMINAPRTSFTGIFSKEEITSADLSSTEISRATIFQAGLTNTKNHNLNIDSNDDSIYSNKENQNNTFSNTFVMPTKYLPKKKRAKVEAKGTKLSSSCTSDEWWNRKMEEEKKMKEKEEKVAKKKELQEMKKKLAEQKKLIQNQMNELQKKIKQETQ